jgi:hypothetical protein
MTVVMMMTMGMAWWEFSACRSWMGLAWTWLGRGKVWRLLLEVGVAGWCETESVRGW